MTKYPYTLPSRIISFALAGSAASCGRTSLSDVPSGATSAGDVTDIGSSDLYPSETSEPPDTGESSATGLPSETGESSQDDPSETGGPSETSDPPETGDSSGTSDPTPGCDFPLGQPIWERDLSGNYPERSDSVRAIAVDRDAVYIVGERYGETTSDILTARLDMATGSVVWERTYDAANDDDTGVALAVDASGDVVVLGSLEGLDGRERELDPPRPAIWLGRYGRDGSLLWEQTAPHTHRYGEDPSDLVALRGGEFLAAGFDIGVWLRRFAPDGGETWTSEYDQLPSGVDAARGMVPEHVLEGPDGSILTTIWNDGRYLLVKHTSEGEPVWARHLDAEEDLQRFYGVALSAAGEIWVAGDVRESPDEVERYDAWVGRYSTEAELLDAYTWGAAGSNEFAVDVAIDAASNIVVIGDAQLGGLDYSFARKLSPAGAVLWEVRVEPTDASKTFAYLRTITTSPDDCSVYVAGSRSIAADDEDGMDHVGYVVKYSP